MRRVAAAIGLGLALLTLSGCAAKVVKVQMDTARLAANSDSGLRLACAYRLHEVVDARPAGDRAGGLSEKMFLFENAPEAVRKSLAPAGFAADDRTDAKQVDVRIMRLYMSQTHTTKVPVVVYQVAVDTQPPFLIRSQAPTMNWNGSEDEAYRAYGRALEGANRQLVEKLNAACAG
jgi:hypothetical protein